MVVVIFRGILGLLGFASAGVGPDRTPIGTDAVVGVAHLAVGGEA